MRVWGIRSFTQKTGIALSCAVIAVGVVSAQGDSLSGVTWECPQGLTNQTLSLYSWADYYAPDTIETFERLCGVTVFYDIYTSNEAMLEQFLTGNPGFDVIVPTGYMVQRMASADLLETINRENIPNFANLSDEYLSASYDPENAFSVPYLWGTTGIAYNFSRTGVDVTSYEQLFNYDGAVGWLDDGPVMMSIALDQLGYDPNSMNAAEIQEAGQFLIANAGNVFALVAGDSQILLRSGVVDAVIDYPGNTIALRDACTCDDFRHTVPVEGSVQWADNMAIPVGVVNVALAEAWIDFLLDPAVSAANANYTGYLSPNRVAIESALINPDLLINPSISPTAQVRDSMFYIGDVGDTRLIYDQAWQEVKAFLGL
jgi:spermidine/putrescine transport system substrate-binding protein